jgi:hypothetical protein
MSGLNPKDVFIVIDDTSQKGFKKFVPARDYQIESYNTFMSNPNLVRAEFNYPNSIIFSIKQFDGDKDKYPSFRIFENASGQQSIITYGGEGHKNKQALSDYLVAQRLKDNPHLRRMGNSFGGNRTKRSRNTKRSKRAHTAKRK